MPITRKLPTFLLILFCSIATISLAADIDRAKETMERYLAAQIRWQENLAGLLVTDRPEFTAIANAQRNHQHALIALKRARFDYLVNNDPQRLDTGELGRFTNFTWSEQDTIAAKRDNPDYDRLEQHVTETRAINDAQPDWDAFRHYFRSEISSSEAFTKELQRFQNELEEIKRSAQMK